MDQFLKMDEEKIKKSFEADIQEANEVAELNKIQPVERPQKSRDQILTEFKKRKNEKMNKTKKVVITAQRYCSLKPFSELKSITLSLMKVPQIQIGCYLPCRTIADAILTEESIGTSVVIEDLNGDIEELRLYNFNRKLNDPSWLKQGTIMLIKEPFLQYGLKAKNVVIRVDSPSDVLFVDETDEKLLSQANALQWFSQETYSFDELKDQAKTLFMKKDYEGSLLLYQRALALQPESEVIYLNIACVLLQLERFHEAYEASNKALERGADREKTLYRLGKAAYGMRMWQQAINHYETLLTESSRVPIAVEEHTKSKTRLNESLTGQYDMLRIHFEAYVTELTSIDAADYTGPVKVADIPGKGKGLIVTQDIKKGTLLFASKAYSIAHEKLMNYLKSQGYNLLTDKVICNTQFGLITETVQKLKRDPGSAKELYALYAGELKRDEMLPNGVIDAGRIEQICSLNEREWKPFGSFSISGLWTLLSYVNHSCLGNAAINYYADFMTVYALVDLKKGDEVTTNYVVNVDMFKDRKKKLQKLKIECDCRLCELDRTDPLLEQREQILTEYHENKYRVIQMNVQ